MSKAKQSLLLGGLVSSAGILLSKILGILYVIPFYEILGTDTNAAYYSSSYNIYAYVLSIATAGLPFAISTLVAKYAAKEDYQMCLLIRKVSLYIMGAFGLICMIIFILLSGIVAKVIVPSDGDVHTMQITLVMLSFALFVTPILSAVRGFFNGLKEMELYGASQVVEQFVRILFLLTSGAIAVYVFGFDRVYSVYFATFSATIAACVTIFYVLRKGKHKSNEIKMLAAKQEKTTQDVRGILVQLIMIAIPFFINAAFGYSDSIINQLFLKSGIEAYGKMEYNSALVAAMGQAIRVINIPMILAPGFSAAIIPFITSAIETRDAKLVKKYIRDCVDTVIYISLPICLAIFVFAQAISVVLFGIDENLDVYTFVLQWYALEAVFATICPIFASISLAIQERNKVVMSTVVFMIVKLATNYLLLSIFGVGGMIISSGIAYAAFMGLNMWFIARKTKNEWKYSVRKLLFNLAGLVGFFVVGMLFQSLGWTYYTESRLLLTLLLALMGIVCCGVYVGITAIFQVPQTIFNINMNKIRNRGKRV